MGRDAAVGLVGAVIVIGVAIAVLLGAAGGRVETSTNTEEVSFDAIPTDGTAIVFARTQSGGLEILGAQFRSRESTFDIGFAVPESCVERDEADDDVLRDDLECAGLPAYGPVVGGGVTREGTRIVLVRLDVSEECYEAVPFAATTWPTDIEACQGS